MPATNADVNDAIVREPRSSDAAELPNVLEAIPLALLVEAAGSEERAQALSQVVSFRKFRSFAASDTAELSELAPELANFARKLLKALEARHWRIERPGVLRWLKLGALVTLAALVVLALVFGPAKWEASRDLAAGAPWKASSFYAGSCDSPAQDCAGGTNFFVHTLEEENPWVEFDLGSSRSVSGVRVVNRTDCCIERARPLVVKVSSDHKNFREVARNTEKFTDWKTTFPTTQARWVRFEIPKRTNLHLRRVRIFP